MDNCDESVVMIFQKKKQNFCRRKQLTMIKKSLSNLKSSECGTDNFFFCISESIFIHDGDVEEE